MQNDEKDFRLSSLSLNERHNHESFQVFWLSSENNVPSEFDTMGGSVQIYGSFEQCECDIRAINIEGKLFLVLTNFVEHLPYFNELFQIQFIYILDRHNHYKSLDVKRHSKLVGIFTDEHKLIQRIRRDMLLTYRSDLGYDICPSKGIDIELSFTKVDANTGHFIWSQLFIYQLIQSDHLDMCQSKMDMLKQLRIENSSTDQEALKDFDRDCTRDTVLKWYTQNSFIHTPVNKAFRTRNPDLMYRFRYFIILLHNKLKELWLQQRLQMESDFIVYRGQIMKKSQLKILQAHVNNLISINTIMSTSRDRLVAEIFRDIENESIIGVLFEMKIKNATDFIRYPFADIRGFSPYADEEEILFFPGALFRVNSVEAMADGSWIVKLTLCNESIKRIGYLMNYIEKQLKHVYTLDLDRIFIGNDDVHLFNKYHYILLDEHVNIEDVLTGTIGEILCHLLDITGNYSAVVEYYRTLLYKEEFSNHPRWIILNILIGYNYFHLSDYENALHYYNTALSRLDRQHKLAGEIYKHIGDVWKASNQFPNALSTYGTAIGIFIRHKVKGRYRAEIYRKISDIYRQQGNIQLARSFERKANQCDAPVAKKSALDALKPLEHYQYQLNTRLRSPSFERGYKLYLKALCLLQKGRFMEALDALIEAEKLTKIHLTSLQPFVHLFATFYETFVYVYIRLKDYLNALIYWKRAIDIRAGFICS